MITKIFTKFLMLLNYIFYAIALGFVLYGVIKMYGRLDKSLVDAIYIFVPFLLVFIVLVIDLFMKNDIIKNNLLFNFVSVVIFSLIIVICLRAQFDGNLILNTKYGISYNTLFLSENINSIIVLVYILFGVNVMMYFYAFVDKKRKEEVLAVKI